MASMVWLAACASIENEPGKRTRGTLVDDRHIARAVKTELREAEGLEHSHITAAAFNYVVLLVGQVPSAEAKALAVAVASQVRKVAGVHDELVVSGAPPWLARAGDAWLSTKIRSGLLLSKEIQASRVQSMVESGVVYLMGLVTPQEADIVVDLVQQTNGISKIVRLFEYLPEVASDDVPEDGAADAAAGPRNKGGP